MKLRIALLCLLSWWICLSASGQVKVTASLDQEQFLPGEAVKVKVRVVNHSGQTLQLGVDPEWLRLTVLAEDSYVVQCAGEVPVVGAFALPPSKMATKELDIAPFFSLSRPGRYSVVATVEIKEWNQTLTSAPCKFDVIQGSKLWEKTFGVPNTAQSDGSPVVRKYLLQQANHLRSQIVLYVRITDVTEEHTVRVVPIGPMVSFSNPTALLDGKSNLHVLYQSGPRVFAYFEISPDGMVLAQKQLEYTTSRPRLSASEDGTVEVSGGLELPVTPVPSPIPESTAQEHDES